MDDGALMERALALAGEGLARGVMPIGAVLAQNGVVVAESFWRGKERGLLNHPETAVPREADRRLALSGRREATLYTTLEPRLMCMRSAMSFFLGGRLRPARTPGRPRGRGRHMGAPRSAIPAPAARTPSR